MAESNGGGAKANWWIVTLVIGAVVANAIAGWFSQASTRAAELEQTKTNVAVLQMQMQAVQTTLASLTSTTADTARNVQTLVDHDNQRQQARR